MDVDERPRSCPDGAPAIENIYLPSNTFYYPLVIYLGYNSSRYAKGTAMGIQVRTLRARVATPREGEGAASVPEVQEPLLGPAKKETL
jgi:hypothetical protein